MSTRRIVAGILGALGIVQTLSAQTTRPAMTVVDVRNIERGARHTITSLQAIANQNSPQLLLIARDIDLSWQMAIAKELHLSFETISTEQAIERFAGDAGQVIFDPKQPWTISLATTIAGLRGAILTDHDLGRRTEFDCVGKWPNKIDAYRWAIRELLPQCDQTRLCYLDESASSLRDYAMQQKLFMFNLDPLNSEQEIALIDEILSRLPPQARIFGYPAGRFADPAKKQNDVTVEVAFVERISKQGKLLVPADSAYNMSFLCRLETKGKAFQQVRLKREELRFDPAKKYVLMVISDGDNLQYNLIRMRQLWVDSDRPKVPMAWTISPQWAELAPVVLETYYREAEARGGWDEFIAGPSGYAYVNPGGMTSDVLKAFLDSTRRSCEASDLRSVAILDRRSRPRDQVMSFLARYADAGMDAAWVADMADMAGVSGRMAYLNEAVRFDRDGGKAAQRVLDVKPAAPFVFVYINAWFTSPPALNEFVTTLGDQAVIVSATEMAELIRQSQAVGTKGRVPASPG